MEISWRDVGRQSANVAGAIFQVAAGTFGFVAGLDIAAISDANRSLIVPADYAFVIWTPIFLLSFAYAAYQALPAHREDPLLRHIGWATAGAFFGNGVWEILFPNRQFLLSEVTLVAIWLFLAVAFFRVVASARPLVAAERWLVALPIGLMFGWITAANVVGLPVTLIALGMASDGLGAAIGGAALLVFGGFVAAAVIAVAKRGPAAGWAPYTAAVLWALAAVMVNQRDDSLLTTATAGVVAMVVIAVALFSPAVCGRFGPLPAIPEPRAA